MLEIVFFTGHANVVMRLKLRSFLGDLQKKNIYLTRSWKVIYLSGFACFCYSVY